jgi:hypothetical protein
MLMMALLAGAKLATLQNEASEDGACGLRLFVAVEQSRILLTSKNAVAKLTVCRRS